MLWFVGIRVRLMLDKGLVFELWLTVRGSC